MYIIRMPAPFLIFNRSKEYLWMRKNTKNWKMGLILHFNINRDKVSQKRLIL